MANPRQAELPLYDLLVIGSGPTGLACAIEAQRRGLYRAAGRQGLPLQLALPLPRAHDLLHHAGAAGDRRHALLHAPIRSPAARRRWSTTAVAENSRLRRSTVRASVESNRAVVLADQLSTGPIYDLLRHRRRHPPDMACAIEAQRRGLRARSSATKAASATRSSTIPRT